MKKILIVAALLTSTTSYANDRLSQEGYIDILYSQDEKTHVSSMFRYSQNVFVSFRGEHIGAGYGFLFDSGQVIAGYNLKADLYAQALVRLHKTNIQYEFTYRMDTSNDETSELEFGLSYYLTDYTAITGRYHTNGKQFFLGIRRWF